MELTRKNEFLSRRVIYLPVERIRPNPNQPRRCFDEASMMELSRSISRYGIIQPLTVRRGDTGYELIAGERRLRAARMAGLREVPCLLARADEKDSSLLALIENLQRRDLHWYEEAAAISRLISRYGLSQEQAAERLGKSQSAVANKLRLLRLSPECVTLLRDSGLSERHARALLRLEDEELRLRALREIVRRSLNVSQTEALVESMLRSAAESAPSASGRDLRAFLNTLHRQLGVMQRAGIDAAVEREDTDDEIRMTIRIPRFSTRLTDA